MTKRIEPHFGKPKRASTAPKIERGDRVVANSSGKKTKAVSAKSGQKKPKPSAKTTDRRKRTNKKSKGWRRSRTIIGSVFYWGMVASIWGIIGLGGVVAYFAAQLPQSSQWVVPERPPNAKIVSTNGTLIANRGATGGQAMLLGEMSPYMPQAVIAIEDRRFKSHFGFDPIGFTRAMVANVSAGRLVQGGSTLTQQLAKNLFLKPDRNISRKVQELVLAVWLESKYSKDQILEMYLNRVYFGSGAYGVDAAARRYFSKSARDLTLAESALLAGLVKAPSYLSPAKNPKKAEDRAQLVLAAMKRQGYISAREATRALTMQAEKARTYWSGSEHYVADMVLEEVQRVYGKLDRDLIVDTTIDVDLLQAATDAVSRTLEKSGSKHKVSQGAAIVLDRSGGIRALIGGREYADSQYNRVSKAKRQPGSSFKPFVYLAALEAGRSPESIRNDAPVKIGNWTPQNYDKKFRGPVTLNDALAKSLNTVAAQLATEVGPKRVIQTAKRLGIRSKLSPNASIALGTGEVNLTELTGSYVPFSNGGYGVEPYLIKRIKSPDGKVLYQRETPIADKVVGDRELGMMNLMLRNVIERGTGKNAKVRGLQLAGKTGTSQKSRDALFVGYSANYTTAVWFGNDDGSPMNNVTGGSLPAIAWKAIMQAAHKGAAPADLPGNYMQVATIVPTPRPRNRLPFFSSGNQRNNTVVAARSAEQPRERRPLAEVGGQRPANTQKKPNSILDLLFGD